MDLFAKFVSKQKGKGSNPRSSPALGTAPPSLSPSLPLGPGVLNFTAGQVATHPLLQLESAFSVPTAPLRLKPATHTCYDSPLVRLAAFPPPDGLITLSGRTVWPTRSPPPTREK